MIRYLYKLMAYKDEYEVARLHLKSAFHQEMNILFTAPQRVIYNFHPPFLRALGLKRKLALGSWFTPGLRLLRTARRLRGTPWDLFGYAALRQEERRLIPWYKKLVETALGQRHENNASLIAEIARLPDGIRGYEKIKLNNIALVKKEADVLMQRLADSGAPPQSH